MNWRDQALCAQVDPDLWFPEKGESSRAAQRICAECPVRAQCLADALANHERWGIWGGLSHRQRVEGAPAPVPREAPPRRHRELLPCGTDAAYQRHVSNREAPCRACTDAHTRYANERYARKAREAA